MKITIDTDHQTIELMDEGKARMLDLYTDEAFELISKIWLKTGWNQKYHYTFSWLGRPIIQLPDDIIRIQEVIYRLRPDVIVETGVAHGGSLMLWAGLCKTMDKGRVIGVDVEIRPHNRQAIEQHELFPWITLIEGSSIDREIVARVKDMIAPGESVLVILDSNHTEQHVLAELEAYHQLITPGSYMVAADGIMADLHDVPRGKPEWKHENPSSAARIFVAQHPEFIIEQPEWLFNESRLSHNITHWPASFLKRI